MFDCTTKRHKIQLKNYTEAMLRILRTILNSVRRVLSSVFARQVLIKLFIRKNKTNHVLPVPRLLPRVTVKCIMYYLPNYLLAVIC